MSDRPIPPPPGKRLVVVTDRFKEDVQALAEVGTPAMRQRLITLSAGTKFVEKLGMRALTTEHNTHPTLVKHLVSSAYPQHMGEICCPHDGEFPLLRALFGMSRDERLLVFLLVGDKTSKGADRIDEWYKSHVATAENLFRIELQKLSSVPKDD